jgi:integrase
MADMMHRYPGLYRDKGGYVVRAEGNPRRKKRLPAGVGPDHPDFLRLYHAARAGQPAEATAPAPVRHSLDWLVAQYLAALEAECAAGNKHPLTLKQRRGFLRRFADMEAEGHRHGSRHMAAPRSAVIGLRDAMQTAPHAANNAVKAVRAMYAWAIERDMVKDNPAAGVRRIGGQHTGATAWSAADIAQYRERHHTGSTARLALELLLYTGCRRGDVIRLGRHNERGGKLEWQPAKRGSAPVSLPLAPIEPMLRAIPVIGPAYLLTEWGRPFASPDSFARRFDKWCAQAGLTGRSAHGVRKALAGMARESGVPTEYLMALLGHTEARTTEIYAKGADRADMAAKAARMIWG